MKAADFITSVPIDTPLWPDDMFEPLTLAFIAPLIPNSPWVLKHSHLSMDLNSDMQNMSWTDPARVGDRLCKFWREAWALASV